MIKSMTGYGNGQAEDANLRITVEIRAVNHKYCELNLRLPKKLNFLEGLIRNKVKEKISRGKIDISVTYDYFNDSDVTVNYHEEVASAYLSTIKAIGERFDISSNIDAYGLARFPEVITLEDVEFNEEILAPIMNEAMDKAIDSFVQSRSIEGANLRADLNEKLNTLKTVVLNIESLEGGILKNYEEKLTNKIRTLLEDKDIDDARILTEVAIMADKICVDEEMVRLKSHIDTMIHSLDSNEPIGRKLDFIAQEMNREANTTLSKSDDLAVVDMGIELKTMIEKIREQVQNIE